MSPYDAKYALLSIHVDEGELVINHPAALEYALLEELSFEAPEMRPARVPINAAYVRDRLEKLARDEDLSRFVL